jgi:hypothetical protein
MITRHTPELESIILAGVRSGGYPHVAAAAAGVDDASFQEWIERGSRKNAREPYKSFARRLHQAEGQARLMREIEAAKDDPQFWLKNGPGRDLPGKPGWAAMIRPTLGGHQTTINLFTSAEFLQFMAMLRAVLAPYPEALEALAAALEKPTATPVKVISQQGEPA